MNEEQMIVKDALKAVQLSGEHGQLKSVLLDALRTPDRHKLNPEPQRAIRGILTARRTTTAKIEPLWHNTRWSLTVAGMRALEQM